VGSATLLTLSGQESQTALIN